MCFIPENLFYSLEPMPHLLLEQLLADKFYNENPTLGVQTEFSVMGLIKGTVLVELMAGWCCESLAKYSVSC